MKKIALITKNKILAESLNSAVKGIPNLKFELSLLLNSSQALLDAQILEIDVAMIDMSFMDIVGYNLSGERMELAFFAKLNETLPNCQFLLLVSQDDKVNRNIAIQAKQNKIVDDYVFYDASLKYLLAKLKSYG